jgi:putative ABC transport system substrate-binding protein
MERRAFIVMTIAGAGWPLAGRAQQKAMPVIGALYNTSPSPAAPAVAAFRQGLSETGWVEGQNVAIENRFSEGRNDRLPGLAADLVSRKVDVILAAGDPAAFAAKNVTSIIPIISAVTDPVATGLVASFPRPGGNLTGINIMFTELMPKRLELLSELVPQAGVFALLVNPNTPNAETQIRDVQQAARVKGVQLRIIKASTESEIDAAFATFVQLHVDALVVGNDTFFFSARDRLVTLAGRHAVPASYFAREFAAAGGLMSYGTSVTAVYRRLGVFAGKILNGAKPADIPVEQPTKFELVINLNTAKALGLTIPYTLLARADEVIE